MGLDGVELVMEVEERFGVTLLDSETSQVRTVADLAALVVSRLPRASGGCPTAHAFYLIRRVLVEHARVDRGSVRPDARWDVLFSTDLPHVWNGLRGIEYRFPELVHPDGRAHAIRVGLLAGVLGGMALAAATWQQYGPMAGLLALALGLTATIMARGIADGFRSQLPRGLVTVGDLARRIAGASVSEATGPLGPGQRLIVQQRVLDEVRVITSEQLGVPLERVKPESEFVKDLGMD